MLSGYFEKLFSSIVKSVRSVLSTVKNDTVESRVDIPAYTRQPAIHIIGKTKISGVYNFNLIIEIILITIPNISSPQPSSSKHSIRIKKSG